MPGGNQAQAPDGGPGSDAAAAGGNDPIRRQPQPLVPKHFKCTASKQTMVDPVIAADGCSYERACIERLFMLGLTVSGVTQNEFTHLDLAPNTPLREEIAVWLSANPRSAAKEARIARANRMINVMGEERSGIPSKFIDPFSFVVMQDPVTAADGKITSARASPDGSPPGESTAQRCALPKRWSSPLEPNADMFALR